MTQSDKKYSIRYIDLCCGIGGFRIGINNFQNQYPIFEFHCVLSADIKKDAIITYNTNFNENIEILDIYDLDNIPQFDLLCCGFPCQPFSSAGKRRGFKDERGGVIFEIIRICKKYKPKHLLLENVSNLISLKKGEIIKRIKVEFENMGYNISYKKINSKFFGVPQNRERVYIVGDLEKRHDLSKIIKITKTNLLKSVIETEKRYSDVLEDFCVKIIKLHKERSVHGHKLQDKRGGKKNIHSWDIGFNGEVSKKERELMSQIMTQRRRKHWAEKKGIKWMDGMPLTIDEIKTFYSDENLKDMLDNLTMKKYLKLEKCKDLVRGKRVYKEDSEPGYNICKGKLSFPISQILDPEDVSPTLTATDSNKLALLIDNKFIRKLTDKELKLVCGFPEDFIIPEEVNKYNLFGNMVTPPVVTALLELILCP